MAKPNSNPNHSNGDMNYSRPYTTHVTFCLLYHRQVRRAHKDALRGHRFQDLNLGHYVRLP